MTLFTYYYLSQGCPLTINVWGLRPLLSLFWTGLSVCLYLGDTGTFQEASLAFVGCFCLGLSGVCTLDAIQVVWS